MLQITWTTEFAYWLSSNNDFKHGRAITNLKEHKVYCRFAYVQSFIIASHQR